MTKSVLMLIGYCLLGSVVLAGLCIIILKVCARS